MGNINLEITFAASITAMENILCFKNPLPGNGKESYRQKSYFSSMKIFNSTLLAAALFLEVFVHVKKGIPDPKPVQPTVAS
ncbi:MAG: hypothetical protein ABIO46_00090 [Chitinophagales bacterium]